MLQPNLFINQTLYTHNLNRDLAAIMDAFKAGDITHKNGQTTHYYEAGTRDGIPLIFIHGWPDMAESWKHQLKHFGSESAGAEYRVIAPDMRGYAGSSGPKDKRAYSLETLVGELVDFAEQLGVTKAVWVGHDWGCGVVNALAAHHPELFLGLAVLSVPYRSIELGVDFLVANVNREIYPEDQYKYGQWDYMKFYELDPVRSARDHESVLEKLSKALYLPHNPENYGKPSALTSTVIKDGGWFGGKPESLPDVPLEYTFIDQQLYDNSVASHKKHGFFPPTAYYLNHDVNAEYAKSEKNGGVLEFPVLFIDAKHDAVCSPSTMPKIAESQRGAVKDLTYETIESGHWVQLEKPAEVNKVLETWLDNNVQYKC
ncbi:Alpha/Beta hydrolase protein [Boeremia exigua]|uniref:Alpha/Beta hydrolase protein n=1 Tax=Boeremia exigua TaxID=749465 RepID=UPI001E8D002D|nr:Alpha/Beta hydrolase protein [Boeremia exigua]KAH6625153.1 Alpha/Beta hydrolase protein [Boeremia exigua]